MNVVEVAQRPPNTHHMAMGLFFRKGSREILQQQLHHVQPIGRDGDWGSGDGPGAEFQHLHVHRRQHGGLLM